MVSRRVDGPPDSTPELLTVREVQQRLKVSLACVYDLVQTGALPCYRLGTGRGTIRISEGDLLEFLGSRRNRPAPARQPQVLLAEFNHLNPAKLRQAWRSTDVEQGSESPKTPG